jgi:outer membrane protein
MMRKITQTLCIAIAFLCLGVMGANAQQKFAYIEFQDLLTQMPEYKKANADMETYGKTLQDQLKSMSEELDRKYNDYQKNEAKMAEAIKELKQKELRDMQTRIQEFQETAQESVRKKESELLKPIIEKAKTAIGVVAKENGYGYVFDASPGTPLIAKPEGDNLMAATKKKLGITSVAPTPAAMPDKDAK